MYPKIDLPRIGLDVFVGNQDWKPTAACPAHPGVESEAIDVFRGFEVVEELSRAAPSSTVLQFLVIRTLTNFKVAPGCTPAAP